VNVNTTIETRAKGKVVVAKGGGKQKTIPLNPERTNAQNHGDAAGLLLRSLVRPDRRFSPRPSTVSRTPSDHQTPETGLLIP
jgi:hypothetical protein